MKLTAIRFTALGTAAALAFSLAGCSAPAASSTAETATADSAAASTSGTADSAGASAESGKDYTYLANFSYSDSFDDNGYFSGIKASDYVTLGDGYDVLTLPAGTDTVSDDDITTYINNNILANFKTTQQVTDRAAVSGDTVNIDYVGSIDGTEFSGGSTNGSGATLVLGSHKLIDDFEDQIVGHTPGETFNVNVTFPTPYTSNPDLAGKDAVFVTTLNYISEKVTPELTDAWVAENLNSTDGVSTIAELKDYVRTSLLFSQEGSAALNALMDKAQFADALPEEVTQYFTDWVLYYNILQVASSNSVSIATVIAASSSQLATLEQNYQDTIQKMSKQMLILQAVAEEKGIVCDDSKLTNEFATYFGTSESAQYETVYGKNYLKMSILHDLVEQNLIDSATIATA